MIWIVLGALAVLVLGTAAVSLWRGRGGASRVRPAPAPSGEAPAADDHHMQRILFPFVADTLSSRALDAALRLARAEHATLVPVFLARVSLDLPLDTPIPQQCERAIPLLEVVEREAARAGVPVESRIERGRSYRHALEQAITHERFDRIVVAASGNGDSGFRADDAAWLLDHAPGEIVVIRPNTPVRRRQLVRRPGGGPAASRVRRAAEDTRRPAD